MSINRTCPISRRRFWSDSGGTRYLYIEAVPVTMIISPLPARGRPRWPCASCQTPLVIPCQKGIKYGLRTGTLRQRWPRTQLYGWAGAAWEGGRGSNGGIREADSLLIRLGKLTIRFPGEPKGP